MRPRTCLKTLLVAMLLGTVPATGWATTTGGVFGPVVNADHQSMQYRIAHDPDSDGWAQRFHYQHSTSDTLMWRGVVQVRKTPVSDADFDFVQAELFIDLSNATDRWKQGLRIDLRARDHDRPNQVGLNWSHQITSASKWQTRLVALTVRQFGDNAADGVFVQSRVSVGRAIADGLRGDLQLFSSYGSTDDFASFDEQGHQLGPFVSFGFGDRWTVAGGPLFGLTDNSPDLHLRLWLGKQF